MKTADICGTCLHWQDNTGWNDAYQPGNFSQLEDDNPKRYAEIQAHNSECGICEKIKEGFLDTDRGDPMPLATCWDGSQYRAELHTHRDFGCVLHEPKSDEQLQEAGL